MSDGAHAQLTLVHTEKGIPVTLHASGNISEKPGSVTISNLTVKGSFLVKVIQAPQTLTLRNEANGKIGVHTSGPLTVRVPVVGSKTIPKADRIVNP
jgi:hypothetical protein